METMRTYVLGVDPGTTTGMAVVMFYNDSGAKPAAVWSDQLPWDAASDEIANRLELMRLLRSRESGTGLLAVGEKFTINAMTAQRGQQGSEDALGMLGVLRREARLAGVELVPAQQASAAKTLAGDQALKNLGLHSPGLLHVNDATRHTVVCALKRHLLQPKHMLGKSR